MTSTFTALSLREVRELVQPMSSVASVYVGPRQDRADDAQVETKLRRRRIARELAEQGADNSTIDAVVGLLARLPEHLHGYAVFAMEDRIVLAHPINGVLADEATYGMPPRVAPLLSWLQRHPAVVLARIERGKAELVSVSAGADVGTRRVVARPDDDIRHHSAAGDQEPRPDRRAEAVWRHDAAAIAGAIDDEIDRVHADVAAVWGDPHAVVLVTEQLRRRARACDIRHLPSAHTVTAGHDLPVTARSLAAEAVADHLQQETEHLLERVGDGAGAVEGATAVLQSLAEGSARTLLIRDDPDDRRRAWFGPDVLCAVRPTPGLALRHGRMADVAIRAALLTGAEVRILTSTEASRIDGSIAVLLRHA